MMNLILLLKDYFYRRKNNPPKVCSADETVDLIIRENFL